MAEQDKLVNQTESASEAEKVNEAAKKPAKAEKKKEPKPNVFVRAGKKISKWFCDLKSEAKTVVRPTGTQVLNNTLVVVFCVLVLAVFVALLVCGFGFIRWLIINLVG